jgi:hypothetical protein
MGFQVFSGGAVVNHDVISAQGVSPPVDPGPAPGGEGTHPFFIWCHHTAWATFWHIRDHYSSITH